MNQQTMLLAHHPNHTIATVHDISSLIGDSIECGRLILKKENLTDNFFDLRSGLVGELFQKCTNYQIRLAIVVDKQITLSTPFLALMQEHQRHKTIQFFSTEAEATAWL